MKNNFKVLLSDNLIKISLYSSLFLIILQLVLIAFFYSKLPPLIPFLNSRPWGEERLVPTGVAFIIPVVFIVIFIINNFFASIYYKKNTLIARILSFNCLLLIMLGFIAYVRIVFLVF